MNFNYKRLFSEHRLLMAFIEKKQKLPPANTEKTPASEKFNPRQSRENNLKRIESYFSDSESANAASRLVAERRTGEGNNVFKSEKGEMLFEQLSNQQLNFLNRLKKHGVEFSNPEIMPLGDAHWHTQISYKGESIETNVSFSDGHGIHNDVIIRATYELFDRVNKGINDSPAAKSILGANLSLTVQQYATLLPALNRAATARIRLKFNPFTHNLVAYNDDGSEKVLGVSDYTEDDFSYRRVDVYKLKEWLYESIREMYKTKRSYSS